MGRLVVMNEFEVVETGFAALPWCIRRKGTVLPVAVFAERWVALDCLRVLECAYGAGAAS
jgi:hypothetical protein